MLVLANKQDQPGCMTEQEIFQGLGLTEIKARQWSMFKISAMQGTGLDEAFTWLVNTLQGQ